MALIPGDKEILPWLLYRAIRKFCHGSYTRTIRSYLLLAACVAHGTQEPIRASSQRGFVAVHQNSPTSIGGGGRNGGSMDKVALISLIGQSIGLVYRPKLIDNCN